MKSKFLQKGFLAKALCVVLATGSFMYADTDEAFMRSSKAFFDEGKVFQGESKQLMDNTHQVDTVLLDFERGLMALHRTSQALKALDGGLSVIETGLTAAEQVPQTRAQAQKLKQDLQSVHKPVSSASKKMESIDKSVVPLLKATHNAEVVASKLVVAEDGFRHVGISYIDVVGKVSQCDHDSAVINILDSSRGVYADIDRELIKINNTYDSVTSIPRKTMAEITKQIEKIKLLEEPIVNLYNRLAPLYDPLNELQHILDKRIGVKAGYPCGIETCYREQSYPCGTKMCKKNCGITKCEYPCGVKTCSQKAPYPCGAKTCDVDISMSAGDAIKGADAIEHKIESILSSAIYTALKQVGLGSIKRELEDKANDLIKPITSKLNLSIDTGLPKLDIDLDAKILDAAVADISKLESELTTLASILDMHSPTFNPSAVKLEKNYTDIKTILNSPRCQGVKH